MFKKYFFSSLIIFFFLILFFISINSGLRRSLFDITVGFINSYYSIMVKRNLYSQEKVINSIKKVEQQINLTNFLTTKSKNTYTDDIYLNLNEIEIFINSQIEIEYFSKVVKKLIDKDPTIYDAIVWNAKIMEYKNYEKDKIIDEINKAIELSPTRQIAYRFVLDYLKEKNDDKNFNLYCGKYHNSLLGGFKKKYQRSLFNGTYLTRFALQIDSDLDNIYIMEGVNLNKVQEYSFILSKPKDISYLYILSNFLPGTLIEIDRIEITNINFENSILPLDKAYLSSKSSFFLEYEDKVKIFTTSYEDEKISIRLPKIYEDVSEIKIFINLSKANLTNSFKC
jgi:hypothetical protein